MVGDVLGHPLVIVLATGVVSGLLVPFVVRGWQDRRKSLEVKVNLIERLTTAVTGIFTATQFAQVGAASQSQEDFDDAYRSWQQESAVLTALLQAYFRDEALERQWVRCRALATAYYVQAGIRDDAKRGRYLQLVAVGLAQQPRPADWSDEVPTRVDDRDVDPSAGLDLGDVSVLRAEVQRQLQETVRAALDARMSLAR